jgi:hypothetical protein
MSFEIPTFALTDVGSIESQEVFAQLGVDVPMMAVTGIDVVQFQSIVEYLLSVNDGIEGYVCTDEEDTRFLSMGKEIIGMLAGENVKPLKSIGSSDDDKKPKFTVGQDLPFSSRVGVPPLAGSPVDRQLRNHLDVFVPNNIGTVYALHLTLEGSGHVETYRSTINRYGKDVKYVEPVKPEPFSRDFATGDAHIFVRQAKAKRDLKSVFRGRQRNIAPSFHDFSTFGPLWCRTFVETQFGKQSEWS